MSNLTIPTGLIASRRALLGGTGQAVLSATAVALLIGCESMAAGSQSSAATVEADVNILNTALGLEYQAIDAYNQGAGSKLLSDGSLRVALAFQADHKKHAEALAAAIKKLGGKAMGPKVHYDVGADKARSEGDVLKLALSLEKSAAETYASVVPVFANRDLAKVAAQLAATEAMHYALLSNALAMGTGIGASGFFPA